MTEAGSSHDVQSNAAASPPPESISRFKSRRDRKPPSSLPDHFSQKGYLSVSDLIGPSWCEYSYQYGILSLSHLPPAQRPQTITTVGGQTLSASIQRVEEREKVLEGGKAVHTVLERQVAPVQVVVQTESREDVWALRLLNIWCDVQALIHLDPSVPSTTKGKTAQTNCVREVPVYGWIQGVFVMGVIDEIEKRSTQPTSQPTPSKTWSSQEEWKREQQRKPKTSPTKAKELAKGHVSLATFFQKAPATSDIDPDEPASEVSRITEPGWGYFLSDTKTRISSWLPAREDQYGSRMQCMTYRRLFDGLCLGALLAPPDEALASQSAPLELHGVTQFDPHATPMDWSHTFASENLDQDRALSDAFLVDAVPLCESWGTDLFSLVQGKCTLHHIRLLLEEGLRQLVYDARKGQHQPTDATPVGVLQPELALNYRQQKRYRPKRKTPASSSAEKAKKAQITATSKEDVQSGVQPTIDALLSTKAEETSELQATPVLAEGVSAEVRESMDTIEGHNEVKAALSQAFSTPSSSPKKPSAADDPSATQTAEHGGRPENLSVNDQSEEQDEPSSTSIGVVRFQHSPDDLEAHLSRILAMWKGERQLRGVSLSQTKRCWKCEWRDGCEWRSHQSETALQQAAARASKQAKQQTQANKEHDSPGQARTTDSDEEGFWDDLDYSSIQIKDQAGNLLDW